MEEDVIVSIRVPKILRQNFQIAMKQANTNASEFLRAAMEKRIAGMVPSAGTFDPIDLAREILAGNPVWDRLTLQGLQDPDTTNRDRRNFVSFLNILAWTVIQQNQLLEKIVAFNDNIANEREMISQNCATAKIVTKNIESYKPPPPPYEQQDYHVSP